MTFLKIKDPKKRDQIVAEYISLRNNIHNNQISDQIGEQHRKEETERSLEPIIKSNKETQEVINEQNKLFQGLLDKKINTPAIKDTTDRSQVDFGPLALKYLSTAQNRKKDYDSTFGIKIIDNKVMFGDSEIVLNEDDIILNGKRYIGTDGLWELMTRQLPNENKITDDDLAAYKELNLSTNNLYSGNRLKGNGRGGKYVNYLKPLLGNGIKTITLPCNPNELIERMNLLFESKKAGNNNVKTELKAIIDELYKTKVIDKNVHLHLSQL